MAIVGALGLIGAAGFGFLGVLVQSLRNAIGEPNGHGDIAAMLAKILDGQAGQDKRLAALEYRMSMAEDRVSDVEKRVA